MSAQPQQRAAGFGSAVVLAADHAAATFKIAAILALLRHSLWMQEAYSTIAVVISFVVDNQDIMAGQDVGN